MAGSPRGTPWVVAACGVVAAVAVCSGVRDGLLRRGEDALWAGDAVGAARAYTAAARLGPLASEPRWGLADADLVAGEAAPLGSPEQVSRLEAAVGRLRAALDRWPQDSWGWARLGRAYRALAAARRAATPFDISQLDNPADLMSEEDRLAATAFRRALELEPNNYDFANELADLLYARGDPEALDWYRRGAEILPLVMKHPYLADRGLPEEVVQAALEGVKQGIAADNLVPAGKALDEMALYHASRRRLEVALQVNQEAMEAYAALDPKHPNLPSLWTRQGSWLAATGRIAEARGAFERALELDPGRASAHFHLGRLLVEQEDRAAGVRHLRAARDLAPRELRFQMDLARVLDAADRVEEAAIEYERAIRLPGGEIPAAAALVDLYRRHGIYDRALRFARRLAELRPDEPSFQRQVEDLNARLTF